MTITQRDLMRATALIGLTMLIAQHAHAQARRDSVVVAPGAPASALNARPARLNWTSDRRAFAVGDLIIVHIDEYTLASANMSDNASQRRKKNTDFQLITPGATAATAPGAAFETSHHLLHFVSNFAHLNGVNCVLLIGKHPIGYILERNIGLKNSI